MKKPRVLFIIDDDQDDRDLFVEAVREVDPSIQCFSAMNVQEALHKLTEELLVLPDMIFLDLNMPRISGKQCLAEIKKNHELSQIPVVIYSTSSFQKDIIETRELGAAHFLIKPSNFRDLCKKLSELFAEGIS